MDFWRRKVREGSPFFRSLSLFRLRTFSNALLLIFFCRNAPWRWNGLLETKGKGGKFFFVLFNLFRLRTFSNALLLTFFCRNASWTQNGLLEMKGKGGKVLFFVLFSLFYLRTFSNILLLIFFCRNAPWRRNGLLETKALVEIWKNWQSIMLTKGPAKIRQLPIYQQLLITAEVQSIEV